MKIIHRAYTTPYKLKKIDPNASELCWHGCGRLGTLIHLLWSCPVVNHFWTEVINVLKMILNVHIPQCPALCILGNRLENTHT